ncbi:MAG: DUF3078 domain-containing protein [Alistipes sp.]|nr:DUF3078 domain-containing protein [Candidatus Alistipes equi]
MKKFYILTALFMVFSVAVSAQVSITAASPSEQPTFKDEIKATNDPKPEYVSEAEIRAERARIRKERNTIELNTGINATITNFNSQWRSVNGTSNSITGIANFLLTHNFTKNKFSLDNKITMKLGATSQASAWKKSQDEWFISTAPAYKFAEHWSFGAIFSLRSQFANGVNDKSSITSAIFSPAYLDISVGFTYKCQNPKFPIKINLSPLSVSSTYVTNEIVKENFFNSKNFVDSEGEVITYKEYCSDKSIIDPTLVSKPYCYGLTLDDGSSRYEGGSSIQIDFDRSFGKNGIFRYRTTLNSFYGWITELAQQCGKNGDLYDHLAPTIRWEHTIDIKATKHFSTQFYFQMYYNEAQISAIQTQLIFGVGLSYTFKNK